MDTGKYIDLGIGLVQTALGLYLAWRAFIVTLKVPTEAVTQRLIAASQAKFEQLL
jgi:hypothetical protein